MLEIRLTWLRIPADLPMRLIRAIVDRALARMDAIFDEIYAGMGRRSAPPERLLRSRLVMILYSVRSKGQLMELIDFSILCRWFVGLELVEQVWNGTVFSKNRDRLPPMPAGNFCWP